LDDNSGFLNPHLRNRLVEYVYFHIDDNLLHLSASRDLQDRVQVMTLTKVD